jgi:hypothetical protein
MSHHENPMKGHPRPVVRIAHKRWWHFVVLRQRSDDGDHVVRSLMPYPFAVYSYVSGHKDAPLTPRARLVWGLAFATVIVGGIALIVFWAR